MRSRLDSNGWLAWHCPGCALTHEVPVQGGPRMAAERCWTFDGNLETPTLSPSVLVHPTEFTDGRPRTPRCHCFVLAGRIEFLGDCSHALAGSTVEMVPVTPERIVPLDSEA